MFTDASLSGWGGACEFHVVDGVCPPPVTMHINALELLTVLKVVQHFAPLLTNQHVMIRTDNKATALDLVLSCTGICL